MKLLDFIIRHQEDEISICEFKNDFSPIQLASDLKPLVDLGFISINWKKKVVIIENPEISHLLKNRNKVSSYERKIPRYMKGDRVDINEPFIK